MGKQRLSPAAAKAKAERDLSYANTDDRKAKRADSQMKRRKAIKNKGVAFLLDKDYDHNTGKFVLSSHNRGGTQSKDKKDGTIAEKNNK
tara:strand:- start:1136 stop:1402 length:267 start_codon:yes stop_codon:yes gene_type:complete